MRRRFACWLFALLTCASGAAAQTSTDVRVTHEGRAFQVQAEAELQADVRTAWQTVTDYERLPQFVPGMRSVQVLARRVDASSEKLLIEQIGEFRLLWLVQPVRVWLEVEHEPFERVRARAVHPSGVRAESSTLHAFEGQYELTALNRHRTRLSYRARFELGATQLPVLGPLAVRRTMVAQFRALVDEIERRAQRESTEQGSR